MTISERLDESKKELEAIVTALNQLAQEDQRLRTRGVQLQGAIEALEAIETDL